VNGAARTRLSALKTGFLAASLPTAHALGTYPAGVRHVELKDEFLEADKQYVASLAPA
jgi:hypothetical protein